MTVRMYRWQQLKTVRMPARIMAVHEHTGRCDTVLLDYRDGRYEAREPILDVATDDMIWHTLYEARLRGTLWVMGWCMYPMLCRAGIYAAFERGDLRLLSRKRDKTTTDHDQSDRQVYGSLVCSDPPTIIDVSSNDGRKLRYLDLANYGLDPETFADCDVGMSLDSVVQAIQDYATMLRELRMGGWTATAASQGLSWWRQTRDCQRVSCSQDPEVRAIERRAWHGGRCEATRVGLIDRPVWYIDVRSMYTYIGSTEMMPESHIMDCTHGRGDDTYIATHAREIVADVLIRTDVPSYPVRWRRHTYYPVGRYLTTLCGPELERALSAGHVEAVLSAHVYALGPTLQGYCQRALSARRCMDGLGLGHLTGALKLSVNASYGSVGKRGRLWVDQPDSHLPDRWGQWWEDHPTDGHTVQGRTVDGHHQILSEDTEPVISSPAIPAWIASHGRCMLADYIGLIGIEHVYYYDTDGMIVDADGLAAAYRHELIVDGEPGMMTIREQGQSATIRGLKDYRIGDRWVQSGVPRHAHRDPDGRVQWSEIEPWSYGMWHRSPWRDHVSARSRRGYPPYRHGIVGHDGHVTPHTMYYSGDLSDGIVKNCIDTGSGLEYDTSVSMRSVR